MARTSGVAADRRENELTPARILAAAERLFAERGYVATTLRAVAEDVGIQNPSIYAHFESKRALYEAVLERAFRPLLSDFLDDDDEIHRLVDHLTAHPHVCRLWLNEATSDAPQREIVDWTRAAVDQTRAARRERRGKHDMADRDLALRTVALTHIVMGLFASGPLAREITTGRTSRKAERAARVQAIESVVQALFGPPPSGSARPGARR